MPLSINKPKLGMIDPNMGLIKRSSAVSANAVPKSAGLADALFTNTQQRVLGLLFGQPSRAFYSNEIIALARSGTGAVQRELARLARSELVVVHVVGRQKHYQANAESPIYAELCGIAAKTMGLADPIRAVLSSWSDRIRAAFVYGSIAKKQDTASSDIDLLVVSDHLTYADLYPALEDLGHQLGRPVNPTIYTMADIERKIKRGDSFVTRAMQQPKLWVIGDDHVLESRVP